jgi:hypothetical protein
VLRVSILQRSSFDSALSWSLAVAALHLVGVDAQGAVELAADDKCRRRVKTDPTSPVEI